MSEFDKFYHTYRHRIDRKNIQSNKNWPISIILKKDRWCFRDISLLLSKKYLNDSFRHIYWIIVSKTDVCMFATICQKCQFIQCSQFDNLNGKEFQGVPSKIRKCNNNSNDFLTCEFLCFAFFDTTFIWLRSSPNV